MKSLLTASLTLVVSLLFVSCNNTGDSMSAKPVNAAGPANAAPAAPAAPNKAAAESEIKNRMSEIATALAKNDTTTLDKYYGDDYQLVNPDGSVVNRTQRLSSIKSGETKYESFSYDDTSVRFNPEVTGAVVITRATMKGTSRGKPMESPLRVTQVWANTKDGWKMFSGHASKIEDAAENK